MTARIPTLVMEDDTSKVAAAHMMPRQGPDEHAVVRIKQDMRLLGHMQNVLKSDQEPATIALS